MEHSPTTPQSAEQTTANSAANTNRQRHYLNRNPHEFDALSSTLPIDASSTNSTIPPVSVSTANKTSQPSEETRLSRFLCRWVTDWWGAEILCWIIAALSLLSIVIVLESHKNQPVPKWPFKITINALISILATISQMCMTKPIVECINQLKWLWFVRKQKLLDFQAFDNASRGPTGSLMLLGKIRGFYLVSLGAVITVLAIAFGPFTQQIVTYPLHPHPSGNATTPLTFNLTAIVTNESSIFQSTILAAMSDGLANNGSISLNTLTTSCSTGNCTWPEYPSLGVCATVVDLSTSIITNPCNFGEVFEEAGFENPGFPCFNYTLPFQAKNFQEINTNQLSSYIGNATLSNLIPLLGEPEVMKVLTFTTNAGSNFSFLDAYLMYQPDLQESINSTLASPIAYGISLGLCVQTYNTIVSGGNVSTSIISSQLFDSDMTQSTTSNDILHTYSSSNALVSIGGVDFGFTNIAFAILTNEFLAAFSDDCFMYFNGTQKMLSGAESTVCAAAGGWGTSFFNSLGTSDPFSVTKRLSQNIATSLTNAFLAGAGGNAQIIQHQGTAFSPQPYVGTNYAWMTFPISLVSLTLIFLVATITKSQRLGSRVWKSSNMATLQGLHNDLHTQLGGLTSISEMEEKGQSIEARFDMEGGKAEHGIEYRLVESKQQWK